MLPKIIEFSAKNKFLVFIVVIFLSAWGIWALYNTPLDAIPDLSDAQVIIFTEWPGRSPDLVEDQITYPIVSSMLSAPRVRVVRGKSFLGLSFVYVIFEDGTDIYWARSRVLEYLQTAAQSALEASRQVQQAVQAYDTPVEYPNTQLAGKLRNVAQLIEAGLSTRIYYVTLEGVDTHSEQADAHAALLQELSDAVTAFYQDAAHHGREDRVALLAFSEFGRRVKENASRGTDHGAAAPLFVVTIGSPSA